MRIGIDLMGSDTGPEELFPAVNKAAEENPSVLFFVIATAASADKLPISQPNIKLQIVRSVISMSDEPSSAVKKKSSSLLMGMRLLKKRKIDAFVTCGNTGALITAASLSLPKLAGIKRPALLASLPTAKGHLSVIDIGGNVQAKPQLLYDFALLGSAFHKTAYGIERPSIGLLNIGVESKKGTLLHREAFKLLSSHPDFAGNIEARDVFSGHVDVLVTDGFTGNILLKTAEGIASFIFDILVKNVSDPLKHELELFHSRFNHTEYPGAILMGVEPLIIKCHGSSNARAFYSGIKGAIRYLQNTSQN